MCFMIIKAIIVFRPPNATYCAFVLEKLQGADILTYLSNRHEYNEQMVATVISQVLPAKLISSFIRFKSVQWKSI